MLPEEDFGRQLAHQTASLQQYCTGSKSCGFIDIFTQGHTRSILIDQKMSFQQFKEISFTVMTFTAFKNLWTAIMGDNATDRVKIKKLNLI